MDQNLNTRNTFVVLVKYFLAVLIFSLAAMIFAREYLIPNYSPEQEEGNISGDPQYYIKIANSKSAVCFFCSLTAFILL